MLHYTAMGSAPAALDLLCDPARQVSAHYLISAQGVIYQLVVEDARAWHAGAGAWQGNEDVNSRSIGIEMDNCGASPFAAALMDVLEHLLRDVMKRWSIPPQGVIAHSDCAPGRKIDPGPRFDWQRLARQNLSVWPFDAEPRAQADFARFRRAVMGFGYCDPCHHEAVLPAFRRRFNPCASGAVSGRDVALAEALARRYGEKLA